jgi:hypothetical protein
MSRVAATEIVNVRHGGVIERHDANTFIACVELPPSGLSPNARLHWRVKAKIIDAYRTMCGVEFRNRRRITGWSAPQVAELEVEYRVHRGAWLPGTKPEWRPYHPKDEDNARASLKAACDALKDAGIIASDAKARLKWGEFRLFTTQREVERHGRVGVTFVVRAL